MNETQCIWLPITMVSIKFQVVRINLLLKFIFYRKATKIDGIFTVDFTVKLTLKILPFLWPSQKTWTLHSVCTYGMSYFCYQDILTNAVSGVFEDPKFRISEGSDKNWSCPRSALLAVSAKLRKPTGQSQDNFNFGPNTWVKVGLSIMVFFNFPVRIWQEFRAEFFLRKADISLLARVSSFTSLSNNRISNYPINSVIQISSESIRGFPIVPILYPDIWQNCVINLKSRPCICRG